MIVRVIAKDAFPPFAVAPWVSRAEAQETITPACRREANASGRSRFDRLLGATATAMSGKGRGCRSRPRYQAGATS